MKVEMSESRFRLGRGYQWRGDRHPAAIWATAIASHGIENKISPLIDPSPRTLPPVCLPFSDTLTKYGHADWPLGAALDIGTCLGFGKGKFGHRKNPLAFWGVKGDRFRARLFILFYSNICRVSFFGEDNDKDSLAFLHGCVNS